MAFRLAALLPWRAFVLPTLLTPEEAANALDENIRNERDFRGRRLDDLHFEITRVLGWGYKNSFVPVISVAIEPRAEGALVGVTMRLHLFVALFSLVWMTGATIGGLASLVAAIGGEPKALLGLVFPLAGALLIGGGFGYEAARAETLLRELFPAAPVGGAPPYR